MAVGAVALVAAVLWLRDRDDSDAPHAGQPFSTWVRLAARSDPEAQRVMRELGVDAVPLLIHALDRRESALLGVGRLASRLVPRGFGFRPFAPSPVAELRTAAAWCLGQIGPPASNAVPALINAFRRTGRPARDTQHVLTASMIGESLFRIGPVAVPELAVALRSNDAKVRSGAVETLGRFGPDAASASVALADSLRGADTAFAEAICGALGRMGPVASTAIPALESRVLDPSRTVRLAALNALFRIGRLHPQTVAILSEALRDSEPLVQAAAIETTRLMGPAVESLFPTVRPLLKHESQMLRNRAVLCLGNLGPVSRPAVPEMILALPDEVGGQRQADFASSLAQFGGDVVPELISALQHPHASVRLGAASALRQIGPPAAAAVPGLTPLINDRVKPLRREAIAAMSRIAPGSTEVVSALTNALSHTDWEVRSAAAVALGQMGIQASNAVPALIDAMRSYSETRVEAATALAQIGLARPDVLRALTELLSDKHVSARRAALDALAQMGPAARESASEIQRNLGEDYYLATVKVGQALWRIQPDEAVITREILPGLMKLLPERDNTAPVLRALGEFGALATPALPVIRPFAGDGNAPIRLAAVEALWRIEGDAGPAIAAILANLHTGSSEQRRLSVRLAQLMGVQAASCAPQLVRSLWDEDGVTRLNAFEALVAIGDTTVPMLESELRRRDLRTRVPVARILLRLGQRGPDLIAALVDGLRHADLSVRRDSARALGEQGAGAVPALIQAMGDPCAAVRAGVALALGGIGSAADEARPGLLRLTEDANPVVRHEAQRALERINGGGGASR